MCERLRRAGARPAGRMKIGGLSAVEQKRSQGRKTTGHGTGAGLAAGWQAKAPAPPKTLVFHAVSRAERPSQQATKFCSNHCDHPPGCGCSSVDEGIGRRLSNSHQRLIPKHLLIRLRESQVFWNRQAVCAPKNNEKTVEPEPTMLNDYRNQNGRFGRRNWFRLDNGPFARTPRAS